MFILSKFISWFLLPPGIFILLLFLSSFLIIKNKKFFAFFIIVISTLSLYFLSIEPIKDKILIPLEDKYPFPDLKSINCDAIVVLGGGMIFKSPEYNGKPDLKPSVVRRLITVYKLWKINGKKIILSGGKPIYNYFSEAEVMANFLKQLDIDEQYFILERNSKNTFENAKLTKIIMEENHWNKVCLITSAYHMPRAVKIFKFFGINIIPVPSDYRSSRIYSWFSYIPFPSNFDDSIRGLHEYLGLFYYKLKYGI